MNDRQKHVDAAQSYLDFAQDEDEGTPEMERLVAAVTGVGHALVAIALTPR